MRRKPSPKHVHNRPAARTVAQAMEHAAVRPPQRRHKVSDCLLEQLSGEGPDSLEGRGAPGARPLACSRRREMGSTWSASAHRGRICQGRKAGMSANGNAGTCRRAARLTITALGTLPQGRSGLSPVARGSRRHGRSAAACEPAVARRSNGATRSREQFSPMAAAIGRMPGLRMRKQSANSCQESEWQSAGAPQYPSARRRDAQRCARRRSLLK